MLDSPILVPRFRLSRNSSTSSNFGTKDIVFASIKEGAKLKRDYKLVAYFIRGHRNEII